MYPCVVLHAHTVRRAHDRPTSRARRHPPRVNGRHQDKSLARARKQRAIELRMTGTTYQAIADEMGYQNSVYTIIKQAQMQATAAAVEDHRQLELDRLDAMQEALWPEAMRGRVSAVRAVLRIIQARGPLARALRQRQN